MTTSCGIAGDRHGNAAPAAARRSSFTSWRWVVDHQSQRRADGGTDQSVDALQCPKLGRAPAKEPDERIPELVFGHEPVGVVL
jgi:hypothetical protein